MSSFAPKIANMKKTSCFQETVEKSSLTGDNFAEQCRDVRLDDSQESR
jgi:hypothetical protein